jgi:(E)-4-hydroxy-3-methylbut-2-enyl-diphosphate synthase
LVADIHYRVDLALRALEAGVSKLRINPGNIRRQRDVQALASKAAEKGIPIRIGINSGSIPGDVRAALGTGADALWASAERHVRMLEEVGFGDIVLSIKASDPLTTVDANVRAAKECDYPLHLGVTEAGPPMEGAVRSSVDLSLLLSRGIGDTVRVSLSGPPEDEAFVAWEILASLGLGRMHPRLVSCPTCARTRIDVAGIASELSGILRRTRGSYTVAVMGCEVNGPGEAREADLAIIGSPAGMLIFSGGRRMPGTITKEELPRRLGEELAKLAEKHGGPGS